MWHMFCIKCSIELENFTNSIAEAEKTHMTTNECLLFIKNGFEKSSGDQLTFFAEETHSNPIYI